MTQVPVSDEAHRHERGRRLKLAIFSSLLVRPLAVLIPLLVVPVFIRYLGAERYGLFEAVSALATWIALSNFGLGFGLRNRLMDCHVSGDRLAARKYVSTLFVFMVGLFCVTLAAIVLVTLWVPWQSLLHAQGLASVNELRWAVFAAMAIPLVGMTLSYAPSIYSAYQEIHRQSVWEGLAKVATVVACLLLPFTQLGIVGAVFAVSGVAVMVALANDAWLWFWAKTWLRPSFRLFERRLLKEMVYDGILLFILQSAVALMFQADRAIIGVLRSPAEVAQYAVLTRVFMLGYGAFFLVMGPLWSAYGEAVRRGDIVWCQRKLRLTSRASSIGMFVFGLTLLFFMPQVMTLLRAGSLGQASTLTICGMIVGCTLRMWGDSHAILLNGAGVLRPQVGLLGTTTVITLVLNLILTRKYGIAGTAWSYPIASLLTVVWAYPWLVRKHIFMQKHPLRF